MRKLLFSRKSLLLWACGTHVKTLYAFTCPFQILIYFKIFSNFFIKIVFYMDRLVISCRECDMGAVKNFVRFVYLL